MDEIRSDVRTIVRSFDLKQYQLVTVHQGGGMRSDDQGVFHSIPHDCSNPDQHWLSRIIELKNERGLVSIAISAEKNPCHAEWPYYAESLTPSEVEDWYASASRAVGDTVFFTMSIDTSQYKIGTRIKAEILSPHIEPGDWYVKYPKPDGWFFRMVINEREFTPA